MMTLQEVLKSVDSLSIADQAFLLDQLKMRLAQVEQLNSEKIVQTRIDRDQIQESIRGLRGMASTSKFSSDEFAQRKQEEIDWEDRNL
jgi:hypothetical protein